MNNENQLKMFTFKKGKLEREATFHWQIFFVCHFFTTLPNWFKGFSTTYLAINVIWFAIYTIGCLCYYIYNLKQIKNAQE